MSRQKILVLWVLLLDILWIWVLIPAYPEMIWWFNTRDVYITLGLTIYSLCSFFATPVLGQMSDKYWRKPLLLFCVTGTALSFLTLLLTHNIWLYLLSRAINGITWGNFSILQAVMTDISKDHQERTKNFGLLGALFGLWFIVGPLLGAFLLKLWLSWIFALCFLFSVIEVALLFFSFKETHIPDQTRRIQYNPFPLFKKYLFKGTKSRLFWSLTLMWIATFAFQSIASVYFSETYGVNGQTIWYVFAWIGVVTAINQWVLLPKFWLKKWNTKQLMRIALIAMVVVFFAMWFTKHLYSIIGLWFLLTPFSGLAQPVYGSEIMKHADKHYTWEITGFMGTIQAVAMFVGPLIGTLSLQIDVSVLFASAFLIFWAYLLAQQYYTRHLRESEVF